MYRGFVIKKSTIDDLPSLYTRALVGDAYKEVAASIELDKRKQREGIKQEIMGDEDGFIDADTLMNACMPQVHEYDIFISHSHRDLECAHRLAIRKVTAKADAHYNYAKLIYLKEVYKNDLPFDKWNLDKLCNRTVHAN